MSNPVYGKKATASRTRGNLTAMLWVLVVGKIDFISAFGPVSGRFAFIVHPKQLLNFYRSPEHSTTYKILRVCLLSLFCAWFKCATTSNTQYSNRITTSGGLVQRLDSLRWSYEKFWDKWGSTITEAFTNILEILSGFVHQAIYD